MSGNHVVPYTITVTGNMTFPIPTASPKKWRDAKPEDLKPGVKVRLKSNYKEIGGSPGIMHEMAKLEGKEFIVYAINHYNKNQFTITPPLEYNYDYSVDWVEVEDTANVETRKDTEAWPELKVGDKVSRGPDWIEGMNSKADGTGVGTVERVIHSDGSAVAVTWPNGRTTNMIYKANLHEVVKVYDTYPPKVSEDNHCLKHKIGDIISLKRDASGTKRTIESFAALSDNHWGYRLKNYSCVWYDEEIVD
jgi:hypothetical protein